MTDVVPSLPVEDRRRLLQRRVAAAVARGWAVEYESGDTAVLTKPVPMSLLLNAAAVFVTGGAWLIYVVLRALNPRFLRVVLTVDEHGRITEH